MNVLGSQACHDLYASKQMTLHVEANWEGFVTMDSRTGRIKFRGTRTRPSNDRRNKQPVFLWFRQSEHCLMTPHRQLPQTVHQMSEDMKITLAMLNTETCYKQEDNGARREVLCTVELFTMIRAALLHCLLDELFEPYTEDFRSFCDVKLL